MIITVYFESTEFVHGVANSEKNYILAVHLGKFSVLEVQILN